MGGPGAGGQVLIERDNALVILREAWGAASTSADIPALVDATGLRDTPVVVDPNGLTTYNCPVSGTFDVSGNVADPNTLTTGDFTIYEASACDSGTGFTVEGTVRIDVNGLNGDPLTGTFELDQTLTFTDFQVAAGQLSTTLNGDHAAIIDTRSAGQVTVAFGGAALRVGDLLVGGTVSNYSGLATIQTGSPFNNSLFVAGTASSAVVAGTFDYVTGEVIQKPLGLPPTDGIFDVYGAVASTARVAVVDNTLVRIEVDSNGSGNYEVSSSVSWQEFLTGNIVLNWTDTGLN